MKNLLKTVPKPLQLQIPDFEVPEAEIDGLAAKLHHTRVSKRVWINFELPNGWVRFRCFWDAQNLRAANRQSRGSDVLRAPCPGRRSI